MSIETVTKNLKKPKGCAIKVLDQFNTFKNVYFSQERVRAMTTNEKQNIEMVKFALAPEPRTTQQIADKLLQKGVKASLITVGG